MEVHLSPEQEARLAAALQSGVYQTPAEVIGCALDMLCDHEEWLLANRDAIDEKIREGIAQLERGEGIPADRLPDYLAALKAKSD